MPLAVRQCTSQTQLPLLRQVCWTRPRCVAACRLGEPSDREGRSPSSSFGSFENHRPCCAGISSQPKSSNNVPSMGQRPEWHFFFFKCLKPERINSVQHPETPPRVTVVLYELRQRPFLITHYSLRSAWPETDHVCPSEMGRLICSEASSPF